MDECKKQDELRYITKNIEKNTIKINRLQEDVSVLKITDKGIEIVISNLNKKLDEIVAGLNSLKWWLLTGMIGPLLLAYILSQLKL